MSDECKTTDPSANVLLFVGNAVKYLEDLHKASERNIDEKLKLHFENDKQRNDTETDRINALRAVDVAAVATANERAIKQAEVLATQMAANAETLRKSVETTATTIAQQLQLVTSQLIERIAALEKANYENVGKSGASSNLVDRVSILENSKAEIKGRSGVSTQIQIAIGGLVGAMALYIIQLVIGK